jgi:hypothetical protein
MNEFTTSTILNVPSGIDSSRSTIAKAVKILSISSRTAPHIPYCKSQVIVCSLNSIDPDRNRHEENYEIKIQKILQYYNRNEIARIQEELNIP